MRIIYLIFIIVLFSSCDNIEFKSFYPANSPLGIELIRLTAGNHGGAYIDDYLLLFRSENRNNSRFGGFLVFVNASESDLLQMTASQASYELGIASGEASSLYNPATGIDTQLAILFMSGSHTAPIDNTIICNSNTYTITKVLQRDGIINTGSWFTMRAYLWDSINKVILEVSGPGSVVQID
jgi:hypothetical protein